MQVGIQIGCVDRVVVVKPQPRFGFQHFAAAAVEFIDAYQAVGNGLLNAVDCQFGVFGEEQNVVPGQKGADFQLARLKSVCHTAHIQRIGENQAFITQIVD